LFHNLKERVERVHKKRKYSREDFKLQKGNKRRPNLHEAWNTFGLQSSRRQFLTMAQKFYVKLLNENHKKKYVGDLNNIVLRSSWERDFFEILIRNPNVLKVSSEEVIIPYYFSVDKKMHRYYPDFWFELKKENGEIKRYLVEVKPYAQTQKPVRKSTRRQSEIKYRRELFTYMKNLSKWQSAINFCINKDWKFIFLTERSGEKGKWKLWDWEDIGLPIEVR
jgi:hypothetical protein